MFQGNKCALGCCGGGGDKVEQLGCEVEVEYQGGNGGSGVGGKW